MGHVHVWPQYEEHFHTEVFSHLMQTNSKGVSLKVHSHRTKAIIVYACHLFFYVSRFVFV